LGPEIRFAGYDGIMVKGKANSHAYIYVDNDTVEVRDAREFWGMGTDKLDLALTEELGDRRFQTCYIGPAGEKLVPHAAILHTVARAAGRGGTGCIMGSKNLKAIAVRGTRQPDVAQHKRFLELLEEVRKRSPSAAKGPMRQYGTAGFLKRASDWGVQAVRNYREGTFDGSAKIEGKVARRDVWKRDMGCYVCPIACKKSGVVRSGPYAGLVHDGPEYETGTMLGPNLMISDLQGILKGIWDVDDFGMDTISTGNIIGFLMEAYEKKYIDRGFLDGIDLTWGNVEAMLAMVRKMGNREGVGDLAAAGVKSLAERIGHDSHKFAIHSKGHELAAWNVQADPGRGICYATSNRGACHLNGGTVREQNRRAFGDSLGLCSFAEGNFRGDSLTELLEAISGRSWSADEYAAAGERIFNLEKCFNWREGFRRQDDALPDRFFEEPLTVGKNAGDVLERRTFDDMLVKYYEERGWDPASSRPSGAKLEALGLEFAVSALG
jgi:aldehyde:ferredoxin oxidoreductase